MRKVILHFGVASVAFVIGIAINSLINQLGALILEQFTCDEVALTEPETSIWVRSPGTELDRVYGCSQLVVSVDSNSILYLNRTKTGTLSDPSALTKKLRDIFERREELHIYVPALALSENRRIDKTVYVKAPPSTRYGDITDLIDAIKNVGAEPVGLIVDRPLLSK